VTAETVGSALGHPELAVGLGLGWAAALAGLVAARTHPGRGPLGIAGLLFAGACIAGLAVTSGSGPAPSRGPWLLVMLLLLPVGWLLADFDARWRHRGLGPVLLAISVAGVYATVPDTEPALVALGTALPLALLAWPRPLASLGRVGAYAATGVLLWVVAVGGAGRGSAIVGGTACLGLLAVEPLARLLDPRRESILGLLPAGHAGVALACLLHLALVAVAARVVGLLPTVAAAVAVAVAELAGAVLAATALSRARRRAGR
jgi:hypothetical protein